MTSGRNDVKAEGMKGESGPQDPAAAPSGAVLTAAGPAKTDASPSPVDKPKRKPGPARPSAFVRSRLLDLLGRLVGEDLAEQTYLKILRADEDLEELAMLMAGAPSYERLFKLARTARDGTSVSKASDPAYVGLEDYDARAPFRENFSTCFAPRLGKRAEGFAAVFEALAGRNHPPRILETGCIRMPGNWSGDGQSTFLLDAFVAERSGWLLSVDINMESIDTARRACSHSTQLVINDSVAALNALCPSMAAPIDLLYLDSFDVDPDAPQPSAIHHVMELLAARPALGPGTIVVVDDYSIGRFGGKGMIINDFFARSSARVLYEGYQKVWLMT